MTSERTGHALATTSAARSAAGSEKSTVSNRDNDMNYAEKRDKAIGILMEEIRKAPGTVEAIIWGCNSELHEVCEETYEWLATLRRFPTYPKKEMEK